MVGERGPLDSPQDLISGQEGQGLQQTTERGDLPPPSIPALAPWGGVISGAGGGEAPALILDLAKRKYPNPRASRGGRAANPRL